MELTIEKMVYGGEGLARIQQCGDSRAETVFVPFVLPGERVEVVPLDRKSGFTRARLERAISPSPDRVQPGCPYFYQCGGCQYQHSSYEHQLKIKEAILRETLLRTAKIEWQGEIKAHPSPPWNYRNRTRLKVQHAPFAMGYYKFGSHELLPVEQCPISSPLINRAISVVWELGRAKALPSTIIEIEFFANADDSELLLELHEDSRSQSDERALDSWVEKLRAKMPEVCGVAPFVAARDFHELRPISKLVASRFGNPQITYQTQNAAYRVSAGSFFQVNRFMIDELVSAALADASGSTALDLYAGVGLFSLPLRGRFEKVTAVESAPSSFADLSANSRGGVTAKQMTTENYLATLRGEQFDFVLADPPRAGLGKRVAEQLIKLASPTLTYVSCDPATLARDLQILIAGGHQIRELHLVDLFPQTFHLETIVHLSR